MCKIGWPLVLRKSFGISHIENTRRNQEEGGRLPFIDLTVAGLDVHGPKRSNHTGHRQ